MFHDRHILDLFSEFTVLIHCEDGTLVSKTLNVAVEAIQDLQEGDRMIALISYVTDLAERLPSRIHVLNGVSGNETCFTQSQHP